MRRFRNLLMEALHQPRLADARLADNQRHLALAIQYALPATHKRAQFILASDEGGQPAGRGRRLEASAHSTRLNHTIKLQRRVDAFELLRAEIFDHEQARDQPMRSVTDRYCAWPRRLLY